MLVENNIITASSIDYSNLDEICGYQMLMCKIFESEGGLMYHDRMTASIREVQQQGRIWLRNVKTLINSIVSDWSDTLSLAAIPRLLNSYDFYYRICNGEPDEDYIRRIRLETAARWIQGDKSIPETYLILELLKEVNRGTKNIDRKYSLFALSALGEWIEELKRFGKFRGIPLDEAYARLRFMINDDLFAYLDRQTEAAEKSRWIKAYKLSDEEIDTLDADTLMAYIAFAQAALIFQRNFDAFEDQHLHLSSKLASFENIHPFLREAIHIDLAKY